MKAQLGGTGLMASYTSGDKCSGNTKYTTSIYMTCSENTTISVYLVQNTCDLIFELYHISACPIFMGSTTYNSQSYSVLETTSQVSYTISGTNYQQYLNYFGTIPPVNGGTGTTSLQTGSSSKPFGNAPLTYFVETEGQLSIWTLTASSCSGSSSTTLTVRSTQISLVCNSGVNSVSFISGDACTLFFQQKTTAEC